MHLFAAEQVAGAPDYLTYVIAIVSGLGSGLGAAYLTGRVSKAIAVSKRRGAASRALWNYHRALVGLANSSYSSLGAYDDESFAVTHATVDDVRVAQSVAHEYATFLPKERQHLVRNAFIDHAPYEAHSFEEELRFGDSTRKLAAELEEALDDVFGREAK